MDWMDVGRPKLVVATHAAEAAMSRLISHFGSHDARRPARTAGLAASALAMLLASAASAQVIKDEFWVVRGVVDAIAVSGNTIYIGGSFLSVGPPSGGGVPIGAASGLAAGPFPKVAGAVEAVASDGAGGWYVGGQFGAIGGVPRINLGHVLADGSVSAWNPNPVGGDVRAIAVSGSTVYVGGSFSEIGG